jgi:hypothetical protein
MDRMTENKCVEFVKQLINSMLYKPIKYKILQCTPKRILIMGLMKTDKDYYYVKLFSFVYKMKKYDFEWVKQEINLDSLKEINVMIESLKEACFFISEKIKSNMVKEG